jgi:hypothetical protein
MIGAASGAAALATAGNLLARLVSTRAVCACVGASALPAVPRAIAGRPLDDDAPPAAVAVWLLVGGAVVAAERARRALAAAWAPLCDAGLIVVDAGVARAAAAIVGVGAGVIVGDRLDDAGGAAPWPDDSSLHLWSALPAGRLGAWLDVGTGAAIAPLAAGRRAARVRATDVAPAAIARAAQGAALSGRADVELAVADLVAGAGGGWELVTFNAPVPAEHGTEASQASGWRRAAPGAALLERFWAEVEPLVADGGEVLVHSAVADDPWAVHAGRGGDWTIARYTPAGQPGFAITRWQPHAADARRLVEIALDRSTPFVPRAALA